MLKRPKPGEDEDEILQMQQEYLKEKAENVNIRPAAQVVNLRSPPPSSTANNSNVTSIKKQSKYAQAKGIKSRVEKRPRFAENSSLVGEIFEKNVETKEEIFEQDDKVYYPTVLQSVLGCIKEKNVDENFELSFSSMPSQGFPVVAQYDFKEVNKKSAQKCKDISVSMDVDGPSKSNAVNPTLLTKSYLVTKDADAIHNENVQTLSLMSEDEILKEKQKLLSTLDPKLIEFIQSKRKTKIVNNIEEQITTGESELVVSFEQDSLWENDVLSDPNTAKWLHFDKLEKDKLKWMEGILESEKFNPDKTFEARFDFNGYLLPYSIEYTEGTKTLFHHGEEPHRPGYSLPELFELARSTVTQQRVMALNTIGGILEYYTQGTYKDIIEIPLSKIFFVIRIALDENKLIILEPALKALRNLIYNRTDEASLDALIGFEGGMQQPCLENDKLEFEELETKESELKDFHLAEIDIITALLRTDILQRIYYILDNIKPSFNCVQYALQIVIRLARDSVETATTIINTDHLMNAIMKYFIPVTSINFQFEPQIVYKGKPILAAVKLLRVLSLQSKEIGTILVEKYEIIKAISQYVTSGVDGTYGLRVQIESFCILANLLHYGVRIDHVIALTPSIITSIFQHVKGTDIFVNSSILSATHGAVVLQVVNKILKANWPIDNIKQQIYPLIKEGVQKWLAQIAQSEYYTCAHLHLLCSALDCCKTILSIERIDIKALNESLKLLLHSKGFQAINNQLISHSNLLSGIEQNDIYRTKNLMCLNTSIIDSKMKVLPLLNIVSPVPFLTSLFQLLQIIDDSKMCYLYIESIEDYLKKLSQNPLCLCDNWFTRIEMELVYHIVKLSNTISNLPESMKDVIYTVTNKLCYILRSDKILELQFLFNNIVFNKTWFTTERLLNIMSLSDNKLNILTSIENIKFCYNTVTNFGYRETAPNIVLKHWQEPILPRDWIYLPILELYTKSQIVETIPRVVGQHASKVAAQKAAEKECLIRSSLEWILFNEYCFPDLLEDIDITDRFCRIMCVFLCDNALFLNKQIQPLLEQCVQTLFKKEKKKGFNFERELVGLHNFQDFYTQFLEQFQAVSYGDPTFAACVLVPLAQKHNVKWRKLLWSEYAGCLRALDCSEKLLCYELNEYFYPIEKDESLIKCYFQALSGTALRKDTIVHKIAEHHMKNFKNWSNIVNSLQK